MKTESTETTVNQPQAISQPESGREAMVFYRSYLDAVEKLPKKIQNEILAAIIRYGLRGERPEGLTGVAEAFFTLVEPTVKAGHRRSDSSRRAGKKGGAPKGNCNNPYGRAGRKSPELQHVESESTDNRNQPENNPINNYYCPLKKLS